MKMSSAQTNEHPLSKNKYHPNQKEEKSGFLCRKKKIKGGGQCAEFRKGSDDSHRRPT